MRIALVLGALIFSALLFAASAAEVLPPRPDRYVNDYAGVLNKAKAHQLNEELAQFERQTSNQIVVAIYPKMQTDSSIEDYCVRIAHAWGIGQKEHKNGAILFVFVQNHKMRIEVGYGLEGALTDMLSHQIIANEIAPRFKAGDYTGGITAGVHAMMAATKGEYKGTGKTVAETEGKGGESGGIGWIFAAIIFILFLAFIRAIRRGTAFIGGGGGPVIFGGGAPYDGGGWSGGGGDSGGGSSDSGMSGGGGDFGGGGASGDW